jgi:23S rRNA (cytidine1920-2'-O)/16S rRNA (cytidine1409-2'-O)-methyltransferase
VLLEYGVRNVTAVDVGSNQLHHLLSDDERVTVYENTDIRDLQIDGLFDIIVCDVSYISLSKIFEKMKNLLVAGGFMVLLFKPQFEVGKEVLRNYRGVVKDDKKVAQALDKFVRFVKEFGFKKVVVSESCLKGKQGNQEYIIHIS